MELPSIDGEETERIVMHVDMDCFYAACERLRNPELEGEPLVIGMGYEEGDTGGAVATASYEAREYGVDSAMAISKAVEKLPPRNQADEGDNEYGIYLPVDMDYYKEIGTRIKEILEEKADTVREVSIDEAYLDVTDKTTWKDAKEYAESIKQEIETEVGVTASIGVAPNMNTAKIASDYDKPDGLHIIHPGETTDFLAPMDIEEVHGIGPKTASELRELDIETAGDLAERDVQMLKEKFGKKGEEIYRHSRGEDPREVEPREPPKSLLKAKAIEPTTEWSKIHGKTLELSGKVVEKARENDAMYRTIGIFVITTPYDRKTRETSLSGPVDDLEIVEDTSTELLEEFHGDEVRKLGVRLSNLVYPDHEQSGLTDWGKGEDNQRKITDRSNRSGASSPQREITDFE